MLVKVGDIINENMQLARQGNTCLVLSNKNIADITYESHVHLKIINQEGIYIDRRAYATGDFKTIYIEQKNDPKRKIQIMVEKMFIRREADENFKYIGDVYQNDTYTVLKEIYRNNYIWYQIKTNQDVIGYIASKEGEN